MPRKKVEIAALTSMSAARNPGFRNFDYTTLSGQLLPYTQEISQPTHTAV